MDPVFVLDASERHASGIAYAADGTLWTGGMKGVLRHWKDGELLGDLPGHEASVNGIAWMGDEMVTVGSDKTVRFWQDGHVAETWKGFEGMACNDTTLVMRKNTGDKVYLQRREETTPSVIEATGLGRAIGGIWHVPGAWAVAGRGTTVQLRGEDDLSLLAELDGHEKAVVNISVSGDGKRLLSSDFDGNLHLWDLPKRTHLQTFPTGRAGYLFCAISPDGLRLAAAGTGAIMVLDDTGKQVAIDEPGLKGLYGLAWSPDGKELANAAADGKVRVYRP